MSKNKFRVWAHSGKNYQYLDTYGEQFIGILDKKMKEIYEGDVVTFDIYQGIASGVVRYYNDYCSFAVDSDAGVIPFMHISLDSLEIIGNMNEDYIYDEKGELIKKYEN